MYCIILPLVWNISSFSGCGIVTRATHSRGSGRHSYLADFRPGHPPSTALWGTAACTSAYRHAGKLPPVLRLGAGRCRLGIFTPAALCPASPARRIGYCRNARGCPYRGANRDRLPAAEPDAARTGGACYKGCTVALCYHGTAVGRVEHIAPTVVTEK